MRKMIFLVSAALLAPGLARAMDCQSNVAQPLLLTRLAPVADELAFGDSSLGAPTGVLSQSTDPAQSVDQVLLRIRIDSCQNMAHLGPDNPAAYKPRTEFDNTPWRFNMTQNGKNMTAAEFSAWMESKGVHVARGAVVAPVVVPPPVDASVPAQPAQPQPQPPVPPSP
ncbi:MAG: hypothetical protein JWL98_1012 [Xanthomonadaceae bacterium]|nr:hypothetical protein [Xanthomonadaceae bacterium]